jgi:fucose 4-O-acetylase-like acetyltransferase
MTAAIPAAPAPPVAGTLRAARGAAAVAGEAASLSVGIEVARVALVIGLVFLHYFSFPNIATSPFTGMDPHHHPVATFVNSFVLFFFFSAVPLLSAISGWLFFGFDRDDARAAMARRVRKRAGSLLAPLVAWNLLAVLLVAALWRAVPTSGLFTQFGFDPETAGVFGTVDAVLGITRLPIAFQFWFIHDLILTVLASPLLWLLLRHAPFGGAALLGAAWLAEFTFGVFVRTDVLFFFYLGALARTRGTDPRVGWNATLCLLGVYTALMALRALAPLAVDMEAPEQRAMVELATRLARPLGVVACWGVCLRLAALPSGEAVARWGGAAFFLHAAHYPLIALVKYALWKAVPAETDAWMLAHYVGSVAVTVALCALAAVALFRLSPGLYAFLAGGRKLA